MDVSIIIVNYKTVPLIINCIHSILEYVRDIEYEVIVVDNHSEDGFHERLWTEFGEKVVCLPLPENIGFGRANNEGVKIAKGRNIFCLNPDTILLNNAVKILSDYLDKHSKVAICGGNIYDEHLKPSHSFRRILPSIFWEVNALFSGIFERILYKKNIDFNHSDKPLLVGYITGADLMIKKNIFLNVNGFCSEYFMYYEETDLCCRIKKEKLQIVSLPEAKIQHLEGRSFGDIEISINRIKFMEKGRLIYYRKHFSLFYVKIVNLIYDIFLISRIIFYKKGSFRYIYYKLRKKVFDNELSI